MCEFGDRIKDRMTRYVERRAEKEGARYDNAKIEELADWHIEQLVKEILDRYWEEREI